MVKENRLGSAEMFKYVLNSFAKITELDQLHFDKLSTSHIELYMSRLRASNISVSTIGIYLRTLRSAYNKSVQNKGKKPFKGVKIPTGNKGKLALSKEEMNLLYSFKTDDIYIRRSIDWFYLSYLLRGINFTDLARLTYNSNIDSNYIRYIRSKTKRTNQQQREIVIKITEPISQILFRYDRNTKYILPVLEEGLTEKAKRYRIQRHLKLINKHIKSVAMKVGLKDYNKLTYYSARHSYAMVLMDSDVNINTISKGLGHSTITTTMNYLSSIKQEALDESDKLLI